MKTLRLFRNIVALAALLLLGADLLISSLQIPGPGDKVCGLKQGYAGCSLFSNPSGPCKDTKCPNPAVCSNEGCVNRGKFPGF
jgi:hypothetical protein